MPRANRRRRDDAPLNVERALGGLTRRESYAGGESFVRRVTGAGASRAYLCPGCQHEGWVYPPDAALPFRDAVEHQS